MKIVIYSANYAPEQTGIGKYSGEMASWLAGQGHEVRVITSMPHYPAWSVDADYQGRGYLREMRDGVEVLRAPLWVPSRLSGLKRALYLVGFAVTSLPWVLRSLFWKPDVVLVVAPALVCAPAGLALARLTGASAWMHVQDFEVDVAFQLGLLKGKRLQRVVEGGEKLLYRCFDRVSTISRRMMERAVSKGVAKSKVVFFPNWVDLSLIEPLKKVSSFRSELGIPEDAVVALYSGSLGGKHGLDSLPQVAQRLSHLPNFYLVVCGEGVMQPMLDDAATQLPNMITLPLQPAERLKDLLGMADIHLLPQSPGVSDLVMPSKVSGMLASGRPVVAASAASTELANVIRGHGAVVAPDDLDAFCAAVEHLALNPVLRREQGNNARQYAERHLGTEAVLQKLEYELQLLRSEKPKAEAQASSF